MAFKCVNVITMKLKLRKIGNSLGVILPHNVITSYKQGDDIEIDVITSGDKPSKNKDKGNVITSRSEKGNVITSTPKPPEPVYTDITVEPEQWEEDAGTIVRG